MGQKVNPIGMRLALTKDWRSRWYADKRDFGTLLKEDVDIRELVSGRLKDAPQRRSNLKVYNPGSQPDVDYSTKIDDILAKISTQGEASLTDRERRAY